MKIIFIVSCLFIFTSCPSTPGVNNNQKDGQNINLEIIVNDVVQMDGTVSDSDTSQENNSVQGYGKFCLDDKDCEPFSLSCFKSSDDDINAICSKECNTTDDCPTGLNCSPKGETMICGFAAFCDQCVTDDNCGPNAHCIEDNKGMHFCTTKCVDESDCNIGAVCKKIDTEDKKNPFYCYPKSGACIGNGTQCEPCKTSGDCNKDYLCFHSETFPEAFCAKKCLKNSDCADKYVCANPKIGKICLPELDGNPIDTCYIGAGEFCDPCDFNFQCRTGVCYKNSLGDKFCAKECPGAYQNQECYSGTFCVPNTNDEKGSAAFACSPPTSVKCIGFKQCINHPCAEDEKCVDGFCKKK